jgi:hypothetical protein
MAAFLSHIGRRINGRDIELADLAEPREPATEEKPPDFFDENAGGFASLLAYLFGRITAHFEVVGDTAEAAGIMLRCAGWVDNKRATPEVALTKGEERMHRSVDYLSEQLKLAQRANPKSVLYATSMYGQERRRWAVCLGVPVTKEYFDRKRHGEVEFFAPEDVLPESEFLDLAMIVNLDYDGRAVHGNWAKLSVLQTLIYQIAAMTNHRKPRIIIMVGNTPDGEARAKPFGFTFTGAVTPLSGSKVYTLEPTDNEVQTKVAMAYETMLLLRKFFIRFGRAKMPLPSDSGE